jgi:hypothetical protein
MIRRILFLAAAGSIVAAAPSVGDTSKVEDGPRKAHQRRLKDCGAEWQKVKAEGRTAGMTWNDYSSECLKKKN